MKRKEIDLRENYDQETKDERQLTIECSQDLSGNFKHWTTDLWSKVILKAIEDAAVVKKMRNNGEEIPIELQHIEKTALDFLFDPEHKIAFDDYEVLIQCPKCKNTWLKKMSEAAESSSKCKACKYVISNKFIEYRIIEKIPTTEISIEELISIWGIEDIKLFRKGCKNQIEKLSNKITIEKKKANKDKIMKKSMQKKQTKFSFIEEEDQVNLDETFIKAENNEEDNEIFIDKITLKEKLVDHLSNSPGNEKNHYSGNFQPIVIAEMYDYNLHQHNILKYIHRYKNKNGIEDLKKARWYLERLIMIEEEKIKVSK